jgi:hypothetical protein
MRRLCAILLVLLTISGLAACNKHGKKLTFKKGEVYYKAPVTKAQASKLGTFLVKQRYFDNTTRKSVQLLKVGSAYQVRFVVKKSVLDKPKVVTSFKAIGAFVSGEVLQNASVEVHFCDKNLKTFKNLGTFTSYGDKVVVNKGEVFYRKPVTQGEAEMLAQMLKKWSYFDGTPKSLQMIRKGALTQLRFVIKKGVDKNPKMISGYKRIGRMIKAALFSDGKVEVHFCDEAFTTIKVLD